MTTNKTNNDVKYNDDEYIFQQNNEESEKKLRKFLNNPAYKAVKGDPEMNYWEVGGSFGSYKIPEEDKPIFFELYDECRKDKLRLYFVERYNKDKAGIVLDFDIYQIEKADCLTAITLNKIISETCDTIKEIIDFSNITNDVTIPIAIWKRPHIEYDEDKKAWKNGIHLIIPSLQLEKTRRKFLLMKMLQRKKIDDILGGSVIESERSNIVDKASAWVPQLLFGSAKKNKQPYYLHGVFNLLVSSNGDSTIMNDAKLVNYNTSQINFKKFTKNSSAKSKNKKSDESTTDSFGETFNKKELAKYNLTKEFCSSYDGELISANQYDVKLQFASNIDKLKLSTETRMRRDDDELDLCNMYNSLNYLTMKDDNVEYIKDTMDLLPKKFYEKYQLWFNVIYILANTCVLYKPLAKWFSRKSSSWNAIEFEDKWNEAVHGKRYNLHITHIYRWARAHNLDKFVKLDNDTTYRMVQKFAFDEVLQGDLQHEEYAQILEILLKNKFVSDTSDSTNKKFMWYEFIFKGDKARPGQTYKWSKIETPTNMYNYISMRIPNLIKQVIENIKNQMSEQEDKEKINYYKGIINNLRKSGRRISQNPFKDHVIKAASMKFWRPNFHKELNLGQYTVGVGNGIIQLSPDGSSPILIDQYNDLKLSHYTETIYMPFDPENPLIQKILLSLRTQHRDSETDAYEYRMGFHAASLDNRAREAIIMLVNGPGRNGKSYGSELHKNTMGDTYATSMPVTFLTHADGASDNASPVLMSIKEARYAYYPEGPACVALYLPLVKRITGGDTLSGRGLYGDKENFTPRCSHITFSNYDYEVPISDIAIWERIRYLYMGMVFLDEWRYDPTDPNQRIKDRSLNAAFRERADVKSAYLSILTFYHQKLMYHFDGVVDKIPHPTITKATMKFRISQDTVTRFAKEYLVKVSPNNIEALEATPSVRISNIANKYKIWFTTNIKEKSSLNTGFIQKTIEESIFKNYLESHLGTKYLKPGYRLKESEQDKLQDGEENVVKLGEDTDKEDPDAYFKSETPAEFIDRVRAEWKELQAHTVRSRAKDNDISMYDAYDENESESEEEEENMDVNNESISKKVGTKQFNVSSSVINDILDGKDPYKKHRELAAAEAEAEAEAETEEQYVNNNNDDDGESDNNITEYKYKLEDEMQQLLVDL
jgi:phage/plasmid-associated DNA primase